MNAPPEYWFGHEKLEVYREAVSFVAWLSSLLEETVRPGEVKDHLDRIKKNSTRAYERNAPST